MRRADAFESIASVLHEFEAAFFSLDRTLREVASDPTVLPAGGGIRPSHLRRAADNIEVTFTLRMFTEFEAVIQDYWAAAGPSSRARRMQVKTLMNRAAIRNRMASTPLAEAHEVRAYRNSVVHDRLRKPQLTIHDCKSRLSRFITHLPLSW